eukprot:m.171263 g.171263  ORF g.171263 m.171263 type:complete len:498 (+) comp24226_c0_seq2:459-1952(+)
MPSCEQRNGAVTAEKVASNRTQASLRPRRLVGGAMSPHSSPSVFPGEKEREKRVPTSAAASPRRSGHPPGSDGTNTDTNDTTTATDNVDTTPNGPEAVGWGWQAVGWWQYGAAPATGAATRSVVVGLLYAALGLGSAVLTSGPVAWMLWIAPHSTFGVRLVAVIVHLCFLAATYLGHALNVPSVHRPRAVAVAGLRLASATLIAMSAVLPQPMFGTIVGGTYTMGVAGRAGLNQVGRWVWRETVDIDFLIMVGVAFGGRRLVHRVLRLCASPRWTTVTVDWVISSAIASVLWARARADVATFVSGGWDPSTVLSQTFPPEVFMSRPELGLFYVLPKQPALAITVGDLLMMSPLAPPLTGAIGAALVGVGLLAAGIQPAPGFVFVAGMWCVGAVADLVGGPLSPGATSEKTALGSVQHDPRRPTSRPVVRVCLGGRTVGIDRCLWLLAAVAMVWCWTMRDAIATSYFGIGFTALRLLVPPSDIGYIGLLLLSAARVLR